jgi:outer membrane protein TolC
MRNFHKAIQLSAVAITILGLTGCSVTTQKFTTDDIKTSSINDLAQLKKGPSAIEKPLSLNEAIERAIKNNRDYRLKAIESTYESKQLDIAQFGMWPALNAQGALSSRNNVLASSSKSISTGLQSLEESTSTDDTLRTGEVKFSWNALDFGLSYVRAKQQSDKFLIAQERMRKVSHQIQQEVREAYWKAVSAQNLIAQINPVIAEVRQSILESEQLESSKMGNMMESLTYRRELLDVLLSLQALKKDLLTAKPKLASLMGLTPGTAFELSDVIDDKNIEKIDLDIETMESLAFNNRPELMETRYQKRISLQETKAAMLSLLPGISFETGVNYTSNSYTTNNSWFDYGVRINMNLFKVFMAGNLIDRAKIGQELAEEQRLAVSMAVLTQVHLANLRYKEALESWYSADKYYSVTQKISDITEKGNLNRMTTKQQVAREKLSKLIANVKRDMAFAELQNSYGNLNVSMGTDNNNALLSASKEK